MRGAKRKINLNCSVYRILNFSNKQIIKKKILIITPWYRPAYKAGGPIVSVFNITEMLSKHYEVKVITACFDLFDSPMDGVEEGIDTERFSYPVAYIHPKKVTKKFWKQQLADFNPNVVWVSGIFSLSFSIKPVLALYKNVDVIVSPRGMLHDSALAVKPLKKKLFLEIAKLLGIATKVFWHATNEEEKQYIFKNIDEKAIVLVLNNLPSALKGTCISPKKEKALRLVMPARIAAEKNNIFALEALEVTNNKQIELWFCGADGGGVYSERFHEKLNALKKAGYQVQYLGVKTPHDLEQDIFSEVHYMYLPSTGENFGHAISDALACSTPVILSDKTPWYEVEKEGVGFVTSLDKNVHAAILNKAFEQPEEEYVQMAKKCHAFLERNAGIKNAEKAYLSAIEPIVNA